MSEKNKKKVIDAINKIDGIKAKSVSNAIALHFPDGSVTNINPINGRYDNDYIKYAEGLLGWRTGNEKPIKYEEETE